MSYVTQPELLVPRQAPAEFGLSLAVGKDRTVRVARLGEAGGSAPYELRYPPLRERTLQVFSDQLKRRRLQSHDELSVLGQHLFATLFVDPINQMFRDMYAEAKREKLLSVRLTFDPGTDELAALPWEYLFAPPTSTSAGFFLSTQVVLVLSRYFDIDNSTRPDPESGPLRVLLLVSKPSDLEMKDVESEELEQAIKQSGKVELHTSLAASRTGFIEDVAEHRPHVLHVIGQGRSREKTGAEIALLDAGGQADWVAENIFADAFGGTDWRPPVVVLDLWESKTEEDQVGLSFERLAPVLVRAQIPAVVAMRHPLTTEERVEFSERFYEWLATGRTVDAAVRNARYWMSMRKTVFSLGAPILCMHSIGGLVQPERPKPTKAAESSETGPARPASAANGAGSERKRFDRTPVSQPAAADARTVAVIENRAAALVRAGRDKVVELNLTGAEKWSVRQKLLRLQQELSGLPAEDHTAYLVALDAPDDPVWQEVLSAVADAALDEAGG